MGLKWMGIVAALILVLPFADGKGQAYGYRGAGSRGMPSRGMYGNSYGGGSGFYYMPVYYGGGWHGSRTHYTTGNGRHYSPGYGNWDAAAGFSGIDNETEGAACGACPCPMPNDALTKKWVWVQMITAVPLCPTCGGSNPGMPPVNGTDSVTFEVDAFMEIASKIPCLPPTTVLTLKLCAFLNWKDVDGGLADDQLNDKQKCITVGAESSDIMSGGRRLLALPKGPPPYFVTQFVVGATSEDHGKTLVPFIKDALENPASRLRELYNITQVLTVEPETGMGAAAMIVGIVFMVICGLCICFICCTIACANC